MTTFLLSQKINTLFGILISLYMCILTQRLVHPTSPILLTKAGPLKTNFILLWSTLLHS